MNTVMPCHPWKRQKICRRPAGWGSTEQSLMPDTGVFSRPYFLVHPFHLNMTLAPREMEGERGMPAE